MNISNLLLIGIVITIFIISLIAYIYWKFWKKNYTRERFIFINTARFFVLASLILPTVIGGSPWLPIEIAHHIMGTPSLAPSFVDRLLALIFLVLIAIYIIYIFKTWDGIKSIRQSEEEKTRERGSILRDLIAIIKKDLNLKTAQYHNNKESSFDLPNPTNETLSWRIQVAELLKLHSNQYKIDLDNDWYVEMNTYVSLYGKQSRTIGILCMLNEPDEKTIKQFISFTKEHNSNKSKIMFLIALKNSSNCQSRTVDNENIKFTTEKELLSNLIKFDDYFEKIKYNFEEKEIMKGYSYRLQDIYTGLSGFIKHRGNGLENKNTDILDMESYIIEWLNNTKTNKHLAILAEYGQGKSVLSERLAYLIVSEKVITDRIPIIINLRGLFLKGFSNVMEILSVWASNYDIKAKSLLKLHYAGKLLIIFEGFDETELVGDYQIRLDHFRKLWEFSTPNAKIIITGRPNFFLNDNELTSLLRTNDKITNLPSCEEIYLNKFSLSQMKKAIRKVDRETQKDILTILKKQNKENSFFDLMSRPSLLFLASVVWKDRNLSKFKNNINSAIVIEEFLKHSYSRQANKDIKTPLSVNERSYFMKGIAVGMIQKSGYTNQISRNDLTNIISALYENFPNKITQNQVTKNSYTKPLNSRFDDKYNRESIFLDIQSCGILVKEFAILDAFKFAHKSFLDLLVSHFFTIEILGKEKSGEEERLINNSIRHALNVSIQRLEKSTDITRFIAQLIARDIDIPNDLKEEEKVIFIFKSLYKYKLIPAKLVFMFIPIFGKSILGKNFIHKLKYFVFQANYVIAIILLFIEYINFNRNLGFLNLIFNAFKINIAIFLFMSVLMSFTKPKKNKTLLEVTLLGASFGWLLLTVMSLFLFDMIVFYIVDIHPILTRILEGLLIFINLIFLATLLSAKISKQKVQNIFWIFFLIPIITLSIYAYIHIHNFPYILILFDLAIFLASTTNNYLLESLNFIRNAKITKILNKNVVNKDKSLLNKSPFLDNSEEDNNNIIIWFIICKELQLEKALNQILSKKAFQELEYNEALFNKDKEKLEFWYEEAKEDTITINQADLIGPD